MGRLEDDIAKRIIARHVSESNVDKDIPELAKVRFVIDETAPPSDVTQAKEISASTKRQNPDVPTRDATDFINSDQYKDGEILVVRNGPSVLGPKGVLEELKFNADIRFIMNYGVQYPEPADDELEDPAIEDFEFVGKEQVTFNDEAATVQTFKRIKVRVR